MNIYPVPGRTVRDPQTGREIVGETPINENDPFWIRRLGDGDVTDQKPKPAEADAGDVAHPQLEVSEVADGDATGAQLEDAESADGGPQ